jgi:hypothetical protein
MAALLETVILRGLVFSAFGSVKLTTLIDFCADFIRDGVAGTARATIDFVVTMRAQRDERFMRAALKEAKP